MTNHLDPLHALSAIEPPASLDALVSERALSVLRAEGPAHPTPVLLPRLERWIYVAGVTAYALQTVQSGARLLYRAFSG
jgi:hypothetical protein